VGNIPAAERLDVHDVPAVVALAALYDWINGEGVHVHPDLRYMVEGALEPAA
jgi:hypothetical protein